MLQSLTSGDSAARRGRCRPIRGFNFISLNISAVQLDFLEGEAASLLNSQMILFFSGSMKV